MYIHIYILLYRILLIVAFLSLLRLHTHQDRLIGERIGRRFVQGEIDGECKIENKNERGGKLKRRCGQMGRI